MADEALVELDYEGGGVEVQPADVAARNLMCRR
jgi:hypothetical protein